MKWSRTVGLRQPGLGSSLAIFFLIMLVFVLGNAALVYDVLSRDRSLGNQVRALSTARATSQQLALRAVRLADGINPHAESLAPGIAAMDRMLSALDRGGVVDGWEVPPFTEPELRALVPGMQRNWAVLRTQLRTVVLGSRRADDVGVTDVPRLIQRQWLADSAQSMLDVLDAAQARLMPQLHAHRSQMLLLSLLLVLLDLGLLLVAYVYLRRQVLAPLRAVRTASERLLHGDGSVQLMERGPVEFRQIARGFNTGTARMQGLIDEMRKDHARLERSDTIFRGLASNSIVGIFLAEGERFSFVSAKMAEIFGYSVDEMVADVPLMGIVVPRERYLMAEAIQYSQTRRDPTMRIERQGRRKDGAVIDIEVFSTSLRVGLQQFVIGLVQDITERKHAESSAQLAAIAYENSSEAIAITDASGVIIDVNPAYSHMSGDWADEVAGELLPLFRPDHHNQAFFDAMWHAIHDQGRWEGEFWLTRKSGESYAQRVVVDTAWNHDGSVNCRVVMLSDITQKKEIERKIWDQAHHDPLTGLPNRQYFNERLRDAVQQADRTRKDLALMFLDLDLFKEVNDSMGHAVGDQLLVEVSRRLRDCAPPPDCFVARLGGDEFVILVEGGPERTRLDALCKALLAQLSQPYHLGGEPLRISASLGVALYPHDGEDAETLMRHVDMAMYVAKDSGRNSYHYFDQTLREQARMQRDLLLTLPEALRANQFFLLFQPIFSFDDGRIIAAETLLRWRHPEFGVIAPLDFLPFVEDRQLIRPLGQWVFEEASRQLAEWRAHWSPSMRLTVNVSPAQFELDRGTLDGLFEVLQERELPADSITLEFDERILMSSDLGLNQRLQNLGDAGMRFSIGAVSLGLPALLHIRSLPFETIKLGPELTGQLLFSKPARVICESMVRLAHSLDMRVVAEGVIGPAQRDMLRDMRCDAGQGFWFGEPMDHLALEMRLRASTSAHEAEGEQPEQAQ